MLTYLSACFAITDPAVCFERAPMKNAYAKTRNIHAWFALLNAVCYAGKLQNSSNFTALFYLHLN